MVWPNYSRLPERYHPFLKGFDLERKLNRLQERLIENVKPSKLIPLMREAENIFLSLCQEVVAVVNEEVGDENDKGKAGKDMANMITKVDDLREKAIGQLTKEEYSTTKISSYLIKLSSFSNAYIKRSLWMFLEEEGETGLGEIFVKRAGLIPKVKGKKEPTWIISEKAEETAE